MKRLVLVALGMFVQFSDAQADIPLPDGCYVAANNPYVCFTGPTGAVPSWTSSNDANMLASRYGQAIAAIIARNFDLNIYLANAEASAAQSNAELNTCIDDYNGLVSPFNHQLSLIKKLRKKCGKACKNIR